MTTSLDASRRTFLAGGAAAAVGALAPGFHIPPVTAATAAGAVAGFADEPWGGRLLGGCPYPSVQIANTRFTTEYAQTFVALQDGEVSAVQWYQILGSGYSIGNGGTLRVELWTYDPATRALGSRLGASAKVVGASSLGAAEAKLSFLAPRPVVQAGKNYILRWFQMDSASGVVSMDNVSNFCIPPDPKSWGPIPEVQPYADNPFVGRPVNGVYSPSQIQLNGRRAFFATFCLIYADGTRRGPPWLGSRGNVRGETIKIAGKTRVRQRLRTRRARTVTAVSLFAPRHSTTGQPMTVQVKNRDTGEVLGTVEIPEDRFPYLPYNGTHYGLDYESGRKGGCTVAAFPTPFQLAADTNFVIEMSAPATADYWMWALHSGKNNFGYSTVEAGPRGTNATFAERSLNGGTSWSSLLLYERTGRSDVDANVVLVTELAAPPPPPPPSA